MPPDSMLCLMEGQGFPQEWAFIFPAGTALGVDLPPGNIEHWGAGQRELYEPMDGRFYFPNRYRMATVTESIHHRHHHHVNEA